MTEQGKSEMETHITQQEGTVKDLERQVRLLECLEGDVKCMGLHTVRTYTVP